MRGPDLVPQPAPLLRAQFRGRARWGRHRRSDPAFRGRARCARPCRSEPAFVKRLALLRSQAFTDRLALLGWQARPDPRPLLGRHLLPELLALVGSHMAPDIGRRAGRRRRRWRERRCRGHRRRWRPRLRRGDAPGQKRCGHRDDRNSHRIRFGFRNTDLVIRRLPAPERSSKTGPEARKFCNTLCLERVCSEPGDTIGAPRD